MRGYLIAATVALGIFGWIAQGGSNALSEEELVEKLAEGNLPPVIESFSAEDTGVGGVTSIAIDVLIYLSLAMLVGGIFVYAKKAFAERMPQSDAAAADFEAAMLAEITGGLPASTPADSPLPASPIAPAVSLSSSGVAPVEEGDAPTPAEVDQSPECTDETGSAQSADKVEPSPSVQDVANELRRLRSDLEPRGPVANLGGAPGTGLAVGWNSGRSTAVILEELPPAFALPNLLRRFDAVIIAPPSSATEPIIIDRASSFFLRDVHVG